MTAPLRPDPEQGLVRGVRAAVLTVPAVGSAALAHSVQDGCGSLLAVLAAAGVCWPAAVALLGAQRRLPALLAWLVGAQVVTHLLLERMCTDVSSGQVGLLHHLQHGLTGSMLLAHLGAVVVTDVVLGRADAGLWAAESLVRSGARALRLTSVLPLPVSVLVEAPVLAVEVPPMRAQWRTALPARRGPPVLAAP